MTRAALALVVVLCAAPAFAQQVEFTTDLAQFGATKAEPIDTDGNPYTDEWLLQAPSTTVDAPCGPDACPQDFRVAAVRVVNGVTGVCISGKPITVLTGETRIITRGGVSKLMATVDGRLSVIALNTPGCFAPKP